MPFIHSQRQIAELFEPKSQEARERFYYDKWNSLRWRLFFHVFFSRSVMARLGRDPEFFRYVEGRVSDKFLTRTAYAFTTLDPHTNPYLQYILLGNYESALPRCYREEYFERIRSGLDRLTLFHGPIQEAAAAHGAPGFHGFNLSDIFEYLSQELSTEIYLKLLSYAAPQARLAYWNMLVPRSCPKAAAEKVCSQRETAETLFRKDKAFFYSAFHLDECV